MAEKVGNVFGAVGEADDTGAGDPSPLPPAQMLEEWRSSKSSCGNGLMVGLIMLWL